MNQRNSNRDQTIQKAISFLVAAVNKSGHNTKPVILHSIRVGLYLDRLGYPTEVVVAGLFHDLLEDSKTKLEEIEKEFGQKVANLALANTFDKTIKDKTKRYQESFARCLQAGKEASLIKAADILDNSYYYHLVKSKKMHQLVKSKKMHQWLLEKMRSFIDLSRATLKNEIVWQELNEKYNQLVD